MACGKYGMNSTERAIWDKRGKIASALFEGKSLEEVAADFEMTVEEIKEEIEAIKSENPLAYEQVMGALKATSNVK